MSVRELTSENFEQEVVKNKKPVVVKAFATWCGPCMYMAEPFLEVSNEFNDQVTFLELDVDHERDIAIKFGISSIPTLLFLKQGNVVNKETGFVDTQNLSIKVKNFMNS